MLYICAVVTDTMNIESTSDLKNLLARKWPEAVCPGSNWGETAFFTGHPAFDSLFPAAGIPYGQLIEITGDIGSGKTSMLFLLLSGITRKATVAYLDFSGSFFPGSAIACGVDINRVIVLCPHDKESVDRPFAAALRSAELIFRHHLASCVVFDLIGERGQLPLTLLHRLRMHTVRAKALVIFLTDQQSNLIPASTTSLKLQVTRNESGSLHVAVARSRISQEGISTEVTLHE
ncbi:hypothetical protein C3F09_07380 [candidate division GN15 bacterium]|uniref:RecA-like N-terminal domain-containing protein n=1 Tax=candidate division GN15 bacterium TaxID=2072418 RepID=A0A855X281_9BACT|nr:MAG: hypothetical protein C3F09_07380 [candidate division GN15 bacterium]